MNNPKQKTTQWKLKGDCSIYEVSDHHKKIQKMFDKAETVSLDLSDIGRLDASFVQLLIAAKKQALKDDVQLRIIRPVETVSSLVEVIHCQHVLFDDLSSLNEEDNGHES